MTLSPWLRLRRLVERYQLACALLAEYEQEEAQLLSFREARKARERVKGAYPA